MEEIQITMPQLGESVTEGTVSQWLVSVGDAVKKYDPLVEVTTDKVNAEVPSSFSGTVTKLLVAPGDTLAVGAPICLLATENSGEVKTGVAEKEALEAQPQQASGGHGSSGRGVRPAGRYSPAVRALAQQHHVPLDTLRGSGRGGRVTRRDVERFLQAVPAAATALPEAGPDNEMCGGQETLPLSHPNKPAAPGDRVVPLTAVRRAIAANMVRSVHEIPHAWMMVEVDVSRLVNYRNQMKRSFQEKEGSKLTYLPFFIKAIVTALKAFPRMNSTWAGDQIIEKQAVNVSLAVAAEDALYVPVIHRADELSVKGLAVHIDELAAKVRTGRLAPADVQGGTFTVNNTGSFGSIESQPIINYPQAAILSIESIVKRPVVIHDMIAIRDVVNLCLSVDHRVLDGLIAGRFLAHVKDLLEHITPENMPIY
ncbi:MAG: dihydrolipoamide acetyltransferase family protein [Sporolactobacillus sp.]